MKDLQARGYGWGDIALLAQKNSDIVRATSWLNDMGVPFISFSSLDVRTRTVAGEMLALLSFLDSPPDDLAFATFVLGRIFERALLACRTGPTPQAVRNTSVREPAEAAAVQGIPARIPRRVEGVLRGTLPLRGVPAAVRPGERGLRALRRVLTGRRGRGDPRQAPGGGEGVRRNGCEQPAGVPRGRRTSAGTDNTAKWAIDVPRSAPSVHAMTIHKAKGLGFPVVVVLLYGESSHRFEYSVLRDGDEDSLVPGPA